MPTTASGLKIRKRRRRRLLQRAYIGEFVRDLARLHRDVFENYDRRTVRACVSRCSARDFDRIADSMDMTRGQMLTTVLKTLHGMRWKPGRSRVTWQS